MTTRLLLLLAAISSLTGTAARADVVTDWFAKAGEITVDDFVHEVSEARVCDGVHYRNSTVVGMDMGRKIGELAVAGMPR